MEDSPKKTLAALIVARANKAGEHGDEPHDEQAEMEGRKTAVSEMMQAMKEGDADMLDKALSNYIEMCQR